MAEAILDKIGQGRFHAFSESPTLLIQVLKDRKSTVSPSHVASLKVFLFAWAKVRKPIQLR